MAKISFELAGRGATEEERQKVVSLVGNRFQNVIFNTTVRLLAEEQKPIFLTACKDPAANQDLIEEISAKVSGLAEELESALQKEYEALKAFI